jgi:orotidine-5'-phosphate decarboxylase
MAEALSARRRLAFALDYPSLGAAQPTLEQVAPHVGVMKVGLELFTRSGPEAVRLAEKVGCTPFLDLKLHDIPETVERAVASACELGVGYLTVHAAGGHHMLERAVTRVARENVSLTLLAVTVLTSMDSSDLREVGVARHLSEQVHGLAQLAWSVGVRGFVCSTREVGDLRRTFGSEAVLVTPGIRPAGPSNDDQKRVGTPADAIRAGSSVLVVGRPIRDASDPAAAASQIRTEIESALDAS